MHLLKILDEIESESPWHQGQRSEVMFSENLVCDNLKEVTQDFEIYTIGVTTMRLRGTTGHCQYFCLILLFIHFSEILFHCRVSIYVS